MLRFEQRFNGRVALVRSVRRDELNPNDLKARLTAHFENPMPDVEASADALALCVSDFERAVMGRLLQLGCSVRPQVGSLGYRIDMVVEGANGRRRAVECDGDRYHGPEQWRKDMRRQRVLERVGCASGGVLHPATSSTGGTAVAPQPDSDMRLPPANGQNPACRSAPRIWHQTSAAWAQLP
jgi:hypothetical protein